MALPIQQSPTYSLTIPSSGLSVKYRPFLVKEQKALLLAKESDDQNVMIMTLQNVIKDCCLDKVDTSKLPLFDLEYMFIQMRIKAVGETTELKFRCDKCKDPDAIADVTIDLTQIQAEMNPDHHAKIPLFGDVGVVMKYPNPAIVSSLSKDEAPEIDTVYDIVLNCIDYIYDADQVYHTAEQTKDELRAFIDNLTAEQFLAIQEFFTTMPKVRAHVNFTCPKCKHEHHKYLEGIESFF